jgi:glycosyl transferase, family 25
MTSDWDYFDKIYCISLLERMDRRRQAQAQFARVGLAERVEFVIVPRHPTDCEQGIYESHMLCMSKGLESDAAHILIFEDDILFDRFSAARLRGCIEFLDSDPDWHMLFLGCMVKGSRRTPNRDVIKIRYRSLTQAYVIRRRFARRLSRHAWAGIPYDDFLKNLKDDRTYAAYPAFAFQSNSRSDNERYLPLDRWRRLLGGLRRLQKNNEFYHRYRGLILATHALALLLIVLAF